MRIPIVQTKLHQPHVAADLVCRQRLQERMNLGLRRPLALVSAPAGYGKSTLVSHWLDSREEPHAWLSLDEADSDLGSFLSYFIAALRTALPDAGAETLLLLEARNLPPVSRLASCLVNELDAIEAPFILALDDYQRISSGAVHDLLRLLLVHPPRHLHLVIATRRDPPLRLAAMRAKDHLVELRLKDLEFAASETEAFLKQDSRLTLGEHALDNLQRVLEGWIAGLRLVGLALRHQDDPDGFLSGLRGGLPQLQDYLIGEVIDAQPPPMREWLRKTCILDRFCPALCEAVCATDGAPGESDLDGETFIRSLEEGNLFGIALDPRNEWYRYHHLFQWLLLEQLKRRCDAEEIATLHCRASEWFEAQGLIGEAIQHALKAGDVGAAAEICERHRHAELNADRWYVVESWLARLPAEIKQQRPVLLLAQAWIVYFRFLVPRLASIVERVESLLEGKAAEPTLLAELNLFRGYLSYWQGQGESSRKCLEETLAVVSHHHPLIAGEAGLLLGLARRMCGQKEVAIQELDDKIQNVESPGGLHLSRLIGGLVFVHLASGELAHARAAAERLQTVTKKSGIAYTDAWSSYMQACTYLHCYDLDAASHHFAAAAGKRYVFHTKAAVDALAGLVLTHQAMQQTGAVAEAMSDLLEFARETGDPLC
ncbi:MAG: AAA family ATPase, partial [Polyangiales bacterium]